MSFNKITNILLVTMLLGTSVVVTSEASAAPARRTTYSQLKRSTSEYIILQTQRNNIPGDSFNVMFRGECTYYTEGEAPITMENTFSFGGDDFPDLLIRRNGRVLADITDIQSHTGHYGTLAISCRFNGKKVSRGQTTYKKVDCMLQFVAPVIAEVQLDSCIGGANFSRLVRTR